MKVWWNGLNKREQKLVASLSLVVIVFIFYSLVWTPLHENIEKGEQKLQRQQALLTFVIQETAKYAAADKNNSNQASSGSLSSIINRSANKNDITIARVQPQNNDVQVWIDNVAFEKLLKWLAHLSNNENIHVKAIDLSKSDDEGQVRVKRLQLGRS